MSLTTLRSVECALGSEAEVSGVSWASWALVLKIQSPISVSAAVKKLFRCRDNLPMRLCDVKDQLRLGEIETDHRQA